MSDSTSSYRIRTEVGSNAPSVLKVKLDQKFKTFEILSLKLRTENSYTFYKSNYGLVVGRVLANGGFGIPNAKVSIFIPVADDETFDNKLKYMYASVSDKDTNGVRYNLLPDYEVDDCYQNVGTFPSKRVVLDDNTTLEIFEKYYKYTTVTNQSGDYMLYGIPTGSQQLHVDIDLSDIGPLSQRPRDMIAKGYNISQFESPNKFKQDTNLNSLAQLYTQDIGLYVYPFTGDTTEEGDSDTSDVAITRCDIQVQYKFEPTCVFMGSCITDTGSSGIGKSCLTLESAGEMGSLVGGSGSIEMIRKTIDGKIEQYQVNGDRNIDGNGVWCYQIPMNLDYVKTDEYGNIVPTDNPNEGLPTRARVRFRISMDEQQTDDASRNRARYLVPNNPHFSKYYPVFSKVSGNGDHEPDYEFGSNTLDESFKDLLWNKVYTVKSYIPRINKEASEVSNKFVGIKKINYPGSVNPFPYNQMYAKPNFTMRFICSIFNFIVVLIQIINGVLSTIGLVPCMIASLCLPIIGCPFKFLLKGVPSCLSIGNSFCDDGVNRYTYYPGCWGCVWTQKSRGKCSDEMAKDPGMLCDHVDPKFVKTCMKTQLADDNECIRFNFSDDWINGCLYFPLFLRIQPKSKKYVSGGKTLVPTNLSGNFCSADGASDNLMIIYPCSLKPVQYPGTNGQYRNFDGKTVNVSSYINYNAGENNSEDSRTNGVISTISISKGVIKMKSTFTGASVYYYKPMEYSRQQSATKGLSLDNMDDGNTITLMATDIVLLGSLDECDRDGIPQFFKQLSSTTVNLPYKILFSEKTPTYEGGNTTGEVFFRSEMSGIDWNNTGFYDQCITKKDADNAYKNNVKLGGLFLGAQCGAFATTAKTCTNLSRVCEFGVNLDMSKPIVNVNRIKNIGNNNLVRFFNNEDYYAPDGYISYEEINNHIGRTMFATMNSNDLHTVIDPNTGLSKYELYYLHVDNFDGAAGAIIGPDIMNKCNARNPNSGGQETGVNLEIASIGYYAFRMGNYPYFYEVTGKDGNKVPRYDNSFYFYFGVKAGDTAIEKFFSNYYAPCENINGSGYPIVIDTYPNSWCDELNLQKNAGLAIDVEDISKPYSLVIEDLNDTTVVYTFMDLTDDSVYISKEDVDLYENLGYKWLSVDSYGSRVELRNGSYKITITDANGDTRAIEKGIVNLNLSVSANYIGFINPWNVLSTGYTSYCDVANDMAGNPRGRADNMGGVLTFTDFITGRIKTGDFRIHVEPKDPDTDFTGEGKGTYTGTEIVIHSDNKGNLSIIQRDPTNCGGNIGIVDNTVLIGVPKPGVGYKYRVTEICGDKETDNYYEGEFILPNPTPFKLYINGIDYDLIYDWDCGWLLTGTTKKATMKQKGLPSENWYNYKDETLYHWELNDSTKDTTQGFEDSRKEVIAKFRDAFYMTCTGGMTITFSCTGDNTPFKFIDIYKSETQAEDPQFNVLQSCEPIIDNKLTINDIKIPSITTRDNYYYGNKKSNFHNGLCYASDNMGTGCIKGMYFVAALDSRGNTRPTKMSKTGAFSVDTSKNGFDFTGSVSPMFGFPIIDKMLTTNLIYWAALKGIPYFDDNHMPKGDTIDVGPFMAGWVNNGYSNSQTITANLSDMLVGDKKMVLWTLSYKNGLPDEDALPTRRLLMGTHENDSLPHYDVYRNTDGIDLTGLTGDGRAIPDAQYMEIPTGQIDMKLTDYSETPDGDTGSADTDTDDTYHITPCQLTETIYSNMTLALSNSSLDNAMDPNKSTFDVEVKNGPSGMNPFIYFSVGETSAQAIIQRYMPNKVENGKYNVANYDEYTYMKYFHQRLTEDFDGSSSYSNKTHLLPKELQPNSATGFSLYSKHPADWDGTAGDDSGMVSAAGWGTTGQFTQQEGSTRGIAGYVFAVAASTLETSMNVTGLAISPVFQYFFDFFQYVLYFHKSTYLYTDDDGKDTNAKPSTDDETADDADKEQLPMDTYSVDCRVMFGGRGTWRNSGRLAYVERPMSMKPRYFDYYDWKTTGCVLNLGGAQLINNTTLPADTAYKFDDKTYSKGLIPNGSGVVIQNGEAPGFSIGTSGTSKEMYDTVRNFMSTMSRSDARNWPDRLWDRNQSIEQKCNVVITDVSGLKHRLRMRFEYLKLPKRSVPGVLFGETHYEFVLNDKRIQHTEVDGLGTTINLSGYLNSWLRTKVEAVIGAYGGGAFHRGHPDWETHESTKNEDFMVEVDSDWMHVNGKVVTIDPLDPTDTNTRQGTIILTQNGSELSVNIFITQKNELNFTSNPTALSFTLAGGTQNAAITSNSNGTTELGYKVTSSPTWVTVTVNGGGISATAQAGGPRNGTIVLTQEKTNKTLSIPVNQNGGYIFNVEDTELELEVNGDASSTSINSTNQGGDKVGWNAQGEPDWITVTSSGGIFGTARTRVKVSASQNDTGAERTATFQLVQDESGAIITLTVTQKAD